eukprot:scaffold54225_cov47-Attheya_sp.AAC.4
MVGSHELRALWMVLLFFSYPAFPVGGLGGAFQTNLGRFVGRFVERFVGDSVGLFVGLFEGNRVGILVGDRVGLFVGVCINAKPEVFYSTDVKCCRCSKCIDMVASSMARREIRIELRTSDTNCITRNSFVTFNVVTNYLCFEHIRVLVTSEKNC